MDPAIVRTSSGCDSALRKALRRHVRNATSARPGGRAGRPLAVAMADMARAHAGDLRVLHSSVDRVAGAVGHAQLDEIAAGVASGTLDGEVSFDMRDVHWNSLDETPTPYGTFVAHVLLHRHRLASDRGAMAATCARIVTTPRLGETPAWAEVASTALAHPDAVVAGAAAAVEISTAACSWRELLARVASEHRGSPLLPAALLFVESAVLARHGVGEHPAFVEAVRDAR